MLKIIEKCRELISFFIALIVLLASGISSADTFKIDVTAAAKSEHNDNLFFQADGKAIDDFINTLSPGLKLSYKDALLFSELSGRADVLKYNENDDLDSVDDEFAGAMNYKISPRMTLFANGKYVNNSRPDYFIEETGLAAIKEIEWKTASCKTEYYITEKLFSSVEYSHDNLQYREYNKPGTETNSGNFVIGNDLGWLSEKLVGRVTLGYSRSAFEGLQLDSMTAFAGLTKNIDEKWTFSIDAGVNNIQSDFDHYFIVFNPFPTLVDVDDEFFEWIAFSNLEYKGELSVFRFSVSRTVTPAPERSGAVERRSLGFSGSRRFTEDLSVDASVFYHTNISDRGEFSTSEIDEESVQVRPAIKYKINRYLTFETAYRFSFLKNRITDHDTTQNVVYCRFFAGYPVFE